MVKNDKYEVCVYDCHKSSTHIFWNTSPTSLLYEVCWLATSSAGEGGYSALLTAHGRDSNFTMHHPVQLWCDALKKCFAEKRNWACAVSGRTNCFLTREGTKQNVSFKQFWGGQQNHVLTHLGNSDKNWNRQICYCLLYTYIEVKVFRHTGGIRYSNTLSNNQHTIQGLTLDRNDGQFLKVMEWRWLFFSNDGMAMVFENSYHHHRWFLAGSTIGSDGFSMVFPILGTNGSQWLLEGSL